MSPKGHCAFIVCYPIFKWPFELWSWNLIFSFLLITWENHVKFDILAARSAKEQPNSSQNLTFFPPLDRRPPVGTTANIGGHLFPSSVSKHCTQFLHEDVTLKCQEHAGGAQLYLSFPTYNFPAEVTWSEKISPWQRIPGWNWTCFRQEFCW